MASLATALTQPTLSLACFPPKDAKPSSSTRWIALKTAVENPHFYFIADGATVFVPTEFVATHTSEIAPVVIRATPLEDHTDIHRGLILTEHHFLDVHYIVADALQNGVAAVYSTQRQTFAAEIKLVTYSQICRGGRRFSVSDDLGEDQILQVLDWIS